MLRNCWVICFCIGRPCNNGKTDIRQTASNHIRSVGYRNVDETQGQKPRPRMSARLPALFRNDLLIFRGEWNLFADYFVSLQRNFNEILMSRELNNTNAGQKVAQILGHSKDLITLSLLSLSLSQVLTYSSSHIIKIRGHPRVNIRLFLLSGKGSLLVFCPRLNVKTNIEAQ